ncbi:MAG: flagellar basal-body rod protein FlgF [Chloroflexota bacterium]
MIRGLYTAASGMMANIIRQQATTNNLANVNTPGYKEDAPLPVAFPEMLVASVGGVSRFPAVPWYPPVGDLGTGIVIGGVETNLSQGSLKETSNSLDLAIDGEAFFAVQAENGATYYTRNGAFARDATGRLVTADGFLVLGEMGPFQLPEGEVTVAEDGTVAVDGHAAGRIRVVEFSDGTVLQKMGNCLFAPVGGEQPATAVNSSVRQGFLEMSNVDAARSMVEMMSALRSYEAEQRALSVQNQTLGLAVNELGRV